MERQQHLWEKMKGKKIQAEFILLTKPDHIPGALEDTWEPL